MCDLFCKLLNQKCFIILLNQEKLYGYVIQIEHFAVVCVIFSTNSIDDILLLLTFICSLVSRAQDVSQEDLEELKVLSMSVLIMTFL